MFYVEVWYTESGCWVVYKDSIDCARTADELVDKLGERGWFARVSVDDQK